MNKYESPIQNAAEQPEQILLLLICSTITLLLFFYLRHAFRCGKVVSLKRYGPPFEYNRDTDPFQYWMAMIFLGGVILSLIILLLVVYTERFSSPMDAPHQDGVAETPR